MRRTERGHGVRQPRVGGVPAEQAAAQSRVGALRLVRGRQRAGTVELDEHLVGRSASGAFEAGSDPHAMCRTLTNGAGMMVAQTWMVPSQKSDVIDYIRETSLKDRNEK
ncbi:MAG: hypothetical protein ACKOZU_10245 [Planctomycetaceae bacterium]